MADLKRKIFWAFLLQLVVGGSVGIAQERAVLTLPEAQQLYLSRSPEVEAERQRIEMARGAFRQAGVLPNPQLNYSQEGFPLGARNPSFFQDQEFVFWGSQKLELGGKRGHRREAARLGLKRAEAEFADLLRRRTAQLKQTFARAYFAQRRRELARQHLRQYGEIRDIHRARYEAGDVSGVSQLRLDLEEVRFLSAVNEAETDFTSAWTELTAFIAWIDTGQPRLELALKLLPETSLDGLKELAYRSRSDLKVLNSLIAEMKERVKLEKSQRTPDLTLGGGYKRDFGGNSFYAAFQLPIPLFDRNQGAIYRTRAELRQAENQQLWKRIQVGAEVQRAYEIYRAQQTHVERLQGDLLNRAEEVLDVTRQSYREGEASLTDYLDALRVRLDASFSYYDLLFQLQRVRIELEKATGTELP